MSILLGIEDHIRVALVEQGYCRGDVLQLPAGTGGEQAVELIVDYRQAPLRRGQRPLVMIERFPLRWTAQFSQQGLGAVVQDFRRQQEAFSPQAAA